MLINRQRGVTLIESMIALLVITIGLLGIAALQIVAMKQNAIALNNSKAVWIGYNMTDRVRANLTQFTNYAGIDTSKGYSQDCMGASCSNAQMVTADASDWITQVEGLPAGRGMITGDATQLAITVMWDDEGTGATGTDCGNDPDVDLTCYTVTLIQ
ncbi:MAG: type IV pilus modification protein PilV [Gammaproteobacteria bacterium]|nr:type IV pilus modification protein PilV [Gammaproteobacteria bacterium]